LRAIPLVPAAAILLAASAALADNASATLLAGDTLHGDILTPGDRDTLSVYLPGGCTFSVDALAEKGSAILPDLEMDDPDGDPVFLDLVKIPGPRGVGVRLRNLEIDEDRGGLYAFRVIATAATSGKYLFRCTAKMRRKFAGTPLTGPLSFTSIAFDAPAGSVLKYSLRPITPGVTLSQPGLVEPDAGTRDLVVLAAGGIPLDEDGTWTLRVFNDSAMDAEVSITASLVLPKSKRVLYLSPVAFGPAPKVRSVTPGKVLDNGPSLGMEILGSGFDPAATVRLERGAETPILPLDYSVIDGGTVHADFDFLGQPTGAWRVVVENPSGGAGIGRLTVKSAAGVRLPTGAVTATEVWWLDFDEAEFQEDLRLAGLQSPSSDGVSALAEGAVKSYAIRWLRVAFGLDPQTGKIVEGESVPVSFVLDRPPATVGAPGAAYNRLVIGGAPGGGDASSNPNYAWGDGPHDPGNAAYDDIAPAGGAEALGVRTRFLSAPLASCVPAYYNALKALRDQPLGPNDGQFFLNGFAAEDGVEGQRYAEVVLAVEKAGKELAGTIAHFVARAMGTADGPTGLAATPMKVGEFDALLGFGFTAPESAALADAARDGLPGKTKVLQAGHFPYSETRAYYLPDALTGQAYGENFAVVGGRPERDASDLEFAFIPFIVAPGVLPPGISVDGGGAVSGTPPLRYGDGTLVGGAFRLLIRAKDKRTGTLIYFQHRINVLVDTANPSLSPAEVALGTQRNSATVNEP
jgi:hypothetical protein